MVPQQGAVPENPRVMPPFTVADASAIRLGHRLRRRVQTLPARKLRRFDGGHLIRQGLDVDGSIRVGAGGKTGEPRGRLDAPGAALLQASHRAFKHSRALRLQYLGHCFLQQPRLFSHLLHQSVRGRTEPQVCPAPSRAGEAGRKPPPAAPGARLPCFEEGQADRPAGGMPACPLVHRGWAHVARNNPSPPLPIKRLTTFGLRD